MERSISVRGHGVRVYLWWPYGRGHIVGLEAWVPGRRLPRIAGLTFETDSGSVRIGPES